MLTLVYETFIQVLVKMYVGWSNSSFWILDLCVHSTSQILGSTANEPASLITIFILGHIVTACVWYQALSCCFHITGHVQLPMTSLRRTRRYAHRSGTWLKLQRFNANVLKWIDTCNVECNKPEWCTKVLVPLGKPSVTSGSATVTNAVGSLTTLPK